MKKRWDKRAIFVLLFSMLLLVPLQGFPQSTTEPAVSSQARDKHLTLLAILRTIKQVEDELAAKQQALQSPQAAGLQEELTQQIQELGNKLSQLRADFSEIAAGVGAQSFIKTREEQRFDWQKQIIELLEPVINELKRLTARPREIDHLRTTIAQYQEQLRLTDQAASNLQTLLEPPVDPLLRPHLQQLQQDWQKRRQEINTQLSIARSQLEQKTGEQVSLRDSLQQLFQLFFRSRGRNLFLAFLALILCWLAFHWLHGVIRRISPLHRSGNGFAARLFDIIYTVMMVFGAIFTLEGVLYLLGDWVLLALSTIFLLGLAWTSRTMLPRFWGEALLMLNLGAMREGERVVYNGVPWRVQTLHFYTRLVNPELMGGDIRLPLHDCLALRSRPCVSNEPWFPTRPGDWVLLDDQTFGKVILQTPEIVRLVLLGGSQKAFSIADFFAHHPLVLSTGFRLQVLFGMDYRHQALVTQEIPTILQEYVQRGLTQAGYGRQCQHLAVEFEEAGASALTLRVLADFTGGPAADFQVLGRMIQRLCVDACNEQGWVIPFTQLTLHVAPGQKDNAELLTSASDMSGHASS